MPESASETGIIVKLSLIEFSVTVGTSSACETTEDDTANKAQSMSEEIIRLKVVFIVSLLVVIWKNISLTAILICQ